MHKQVSVTIESNLGQEVQVWCRGNLMMTVNMLSILYKGKVGADGGLAVSVRGVQFLITKAIRMKLAFFAILLACSFPIETFAQGETQTAPAAQITSTDLSSVTDVRQLFGERETLIKQLRDLDQDIAEQSEKIRNLPPANTLEQDLQKLNRDLENAQKATPPDQQRIDALKRAIDGTNDSLQIVNNSAPILRAKRADQDQKRQRLFDIEQRIASLFDATRDTNRFRSGATWAFT